ncbi:MAG: hypothetical protein ABJA02_05450 [Acidobacteriota bacterium]
MIVQRKFTTLRLAVLSAFVSAAVAIPAQATPQPSPTPVATLAQYTFPTPKERFNRYANEMFGPTALAKCALSAGFSTLRNTPEELGPTWRGAANRFGSGEFFRK